MGPDPDYHRLERTEQQRQIWGSGLGAFEHTAFCAAHYQKAQLELFWVTNTQLISNV